MSVVLKCSKCGKPLEPAALPKDAGKLWCPLCADLKDASGVNVVQPSLGGDEKMQGHDQLQHLSAPPNGQPAGGAKSFHVIVGDVAFDCQVRVDLTIGSTKVTIT